MDPANVVREWVQRFNAGDVDGLVELYAEDAINDQVVFSQPMVGRDAIRGLFEAEFARAEMECILVEIHEAGEWAILEWRDPLGLRGCGFFHVLDGRITHQRGYFDQLSFFRQQGLPVPDDYLDA